MKYLLIAMTLLASSCSIRSAYPALGSMAGGAVGSLGGPLTGGAAALGGYGIGKASQVGGDHKELVAAVQAMSEGDVNALVQLKLEEARSSGFFDGILDQVWAFLKLCLIGVVVWQAVPLIFTHVSNKKTRKHLEENGITKKI